MSHQPNLGNRTNRTHGRSVPNLPRYGVPPGDGDDFIYDPYGVCEWEHDGADWDDGGPMFQGMTYHPATGVSFCPSRGYDPAEGRFLRVDPDSFIEGCNTYNAFGDDPSNAVNPLGDKELS